MKNHFQWTSAVLILCFGFSALFAGAEKRVQKTFEVRPGGTLVIEADMGSIDIETSEANQVDAGILIRLKNGGESKLERLLDELDLDSGQSGDDVTVTLKKKDRKWWSGFKYNGLTVHFKVTVPHQYNVDLKTAGGSIEVADLEGTVDVATSGGGLDIGNITGPVHGKTSGGSISVKSCQGDVAVKTSGGSLKLGEIAGTVIGKTSGGSIHVDEVGGRINASTSGGGIHVTITKQPEAECKLSTSGGGITAYLAEDIGVDVDAKTSGGGVSTDFPVTTQGKPDGHSLQAEINGGGPPLILRTSGGGIHIKRFNP